MSREHNGIAGLSRADALRRREREARRAAVAAELREIGAGVSL